MNKWAILASLVATTLAASQSCLYCKFADTSSSLFYSFSYCQKSDECLEDQWNYYNQWCTSGWIPGWELDIDSNCEADKKNTCGEFESEQAKMGVYFNSSAYLFEGEYCSIKVDATQAVARLILDDFDEIGILYNGYKIGEPITVPAGTVKEFIVFNGNKAGHAKFTVSFSSAKALGTAATLAVAALLSYL
uniref:Uncharacterized protein n=1 Tax=Strombidium inclinatum TaxID=197538 RepID=A0A7S3IQ18_9SPIT|mmetsp:Transcript_33121/g.50784  ORF Transcript_33121/g.50784 Transcript_33121/m.50784 type:complete len:191 (+) Transcript_33121:1-573(+)